MTMGSCTVSLARPILREIHQEIQQIKIERSQIYENRTVNEPQLPEGRGRSALPRTANLGEQENRPDAGGQIREPVEELHVGEPPAPPVGVGGTGQNKRDDSKSGRGSREPQGTADTGASDRTADAGHRGHDGKSRPHGHDNRHSGGNRDQRIGTATPITQRAEPPTDGKQPSVGGFFSVPPTSKAPAPVSVQEAPEQVPALDEEEISDLIDVVLCADDITPDTREWTAEIHKFFEGGHKQTTKSKILKAFYGKLDTDYTTETGEYLYLTAGDDGLTFEIKGQQFTEDYGTLVSRIDRLILTGAYPFSSADTVIDDYAIPDELEEMQGFTNEDEEKSDEPSASAELSETDRQKIIDEYLQQGSGTQGGRQRIFQVMLSMPAKKDRVSFIRKEYNSYGCYSSQPNGDRWRLESTPKGLAVDYRLGSLELNEVLSWNQVESGIL